MKILQITKFYNEGARAGGVGRHVLQLHRLLEGEGHEVIPFGMNESGRHDGANASEYFVSETELDGTGTIVEKAKAVARMFWSHEASVSLNALIDDVRPDVAHVHNAYHHLSPSVLSVLARRGIPIVQTAHDFKRIKADYVLYPEGEQPSHAEGFSLRSALLAAEFAFVRGFRFYERHVNRTIVPSAFMRDRFVEKGQDPESLLLLSHPRPIEPPEAVPGFEEREGLLFVGRLSKEKGILNLLHAMANDESVPNLTILGDGPQRDVVEGAVRKNGLSKRVRLEGHVGMKRVQEAMKKAKLLVVPSLFCEPFGLVVLEAAATGLPAVVSGRGALEELVTDGRGWTTDVGSAKEFASELQKRSTKNIAKALSIAFQ